MIAHARIVQSHRGQVTGSISSVDVINERDPRGQRPGTGLTRTSSDPNITSAVSIFEIPLSSGEGRGAGGEGNLPNCWPGPVGTVGRLDPTLRHHRQLIWPSRCLEGLPILAVRFFPTP